MYCNLYTKLNTSKYKGKTVKEVADFDRNYLIWLHNSFLNIYLGRSVFEYLGIWKQYKDTDICKKQYCLNK